MSEVADSVLHGMPWLGTRRSVPMLGITTHYGRALGGTTVHGWGQVPIDASKAHELAGRKGGKSGVDQLYKRSQSMQWLVIDEISTLAVLVAGVFDSKLRRARKRHPDARRPDGTERPFGGINVTVAGDWWQLPPVRARGFYSNPFADGLEFAEQRAMRYFWERNEDSFQRVFELKKPHRQTDRWFSMFFSSTSTAVRIGRRTALCTDSRRCIRALGCPS